ncbi:MAG: hypothetical protein II694_11470, partial [Lachnospiraceae bacterium]|nr:hypothetical protein [Lachnospiraceae bacterium]
RISQLKIYKNITEEKNTMWISDACIIMEESGGAYAAENRNRAATMVMDKNYLEVKKLLVEQREILDAMASEFMSIIRI